MRWWDWTSWTQQDKKCLVAVRDRYMRDGEGFLLVYSLIERTTFVPMAKISEQIKRVKDTDRHVPIVLVGNKVGVSGTGERQWEWWVSVGPVSVSGSGGCQWEWWASVGVVGVSGSGGCQWEWWASVGMVGGGGSGGLRGSIYMYTICTVN